VTARCTHFSEIPKLLAIGRDVPSGILFLDLRDKKTPFSKKSDKVSNFVYKTDT
jgi:hypothetical protein